MARTDSEIKTEIDELEKLLSSGASQISIDGVSTTYRTASELNSRIAQLKQELETRNGETQTTIYRNVSLSNGASL